MSVQSSLSLGSVVVRKADIVEAETSGEVMALNVERGACHGLNHVGSHIWRLLAKPVGIGELCAQLISEYDVDEATCQTQVLELLEEMRRHGLIDVPSEGRFSVAPGL